MPNAEMTDFFSGGSIKRIFVLCSSNKDNLKPTDLYQLDPDEAVDLRVPTGTE